MSDIKLISIDKDGVAWVEVSDATYGIVNAFHVLDFYGNKIEDKSAFDLLDEYSNFDNDFDRGVNVIDLYFENGESAELLIKCEGVELNSLD